MLEFKIQSDERNLVELTFRLRIFEAYTSCCINQSTFLVVLVHETQFQEHILIQ